MNRKCALEEGTESEDFFFPQDRISEIFLKSGQVCFSPACRVIILSTGCSSGGLKMHCLFGHCYKSTIFILRRLKPSPLFSSQIISVKTLPPSVLIRRSTTDNTLQIVSEETASNSFS